MFLLRSAFWLTLVILLIPPDPETGDAPRVTILNAVMAVHETAAGLSDFCERNAEICTTGSTAFQLVGETTGNGIEMISRYLTGAGEPAAPPVGGIDIAPGTPGGTRGTLSTDDRALPWKGTPGDDPN